MSERIRSSGRIAVRRIGVSECSSSSSRVVCQRDWALVGSPCQGLLEKEGLLSLLPPSQSRVPAYGGSIRNKRNYLSFPTYGTRSSPQRDAVERALCRISGPGLCNLREEAEEASFHRSRCGLLCAKSLFETTSRPVRSGSASPSQKRGSNKDVPNFHLRERANVVPTVCNGNTFVLSAEEPRNPNQLGGDGGTSHASNSSTGS